MLDRTGLTRQAATFHGGHHVKLVFHTGHLKRLAQDHLQNGTRKIHVQLFAVHSHLAGARLDPDAGNRVFPLAGGIGAAQLIALWLGQGNGLFHNCSVGGGVANNGLKIFERVDLISHVPQLRVFLEFIDFTSSTSGFCASCGCSPPA